MGISRIERETIICFNAEESTATVCTFDPRVMRKLDNLVGKFPDMFILDGEHRNNGELIGKDYIVPKKYVKFGKPVVLTEEQKKALAERGKELHQRKCDFELKT